MQRLAGYPVAISDVGHRRPTHNFQDCFVALFHQPQLYEHGVDLPQLATSLLLTKVWGRRGKSLSVKQVPEPRPESVKHLPEPMCQVCAGATQQNQTGLDDFSWAACGQRLIARLLPKSKAQLVTGLYEVAGAGFEPATFGL
jgi:hypothetical protein